MNLSLGERPVCMPVSTTSGPPSASARVAACERVLVELRRRRVPEDVPAHRHPVLVRARPDRERSRSRSIHAYADSGPWPTSVELRENARQNASATARPPARSPLVALVALVGVARRLRPPSLRRRAGARRERHAPIVRIVEQTEGVRPRRAVHPDRHRPAARRADRGAPRTVEPSPTSSRSRRRPTDLVDRYEYHLDFPGDAAQPGLRLRALGQTSHRGQRARSSTRTS